MATQKELAKKYNVSERTIRNWKINGKLKELEEKAEIGKAEIGKAEIGKAEIGKAEIGKAETELKYLNTIKELELLLQEKDNEMEKLKDDFECQERALQNKIIKLVARLDRLSAIENLIDIRGFDFVINKLLKN